MKLFIGCVAVFLIFFAFQGCGSDSDSNSAGPTEDVSFSSQVQAIFNSNCTTGCHTAGGTAAFLRLNAAVSYANLVNRQATRSTGTLVVPGTSSSSVLYMRISGTSAGERMPQGGSALSTEDQTTIRTWINEGARNN